MKMTFKGEKGHTYMQWILALIANTTIFTYGLQLGWMSPSKKILQAEDSPAGHPLSDHAISIVTAVMSLAAGFTTPVYAWTADKYGRKASIIAIAVPQAVGWLLTLSYTSVSTLIVARTICGIASGGCFNIVPMYTKEISQENIRGQLGTFVMLFNSMGVLTMYALGTYLGYYTVLWIVLWVPIINILVMVRAPESPAYLVKIGKIEEATKIIAILRGLTPDDAEVTKVIDALKKEDENFRSLPSITFVGIMKSKVHRKCFVLLLAINVVLCWNGCFAIYNYAASIIESSGGTISPEVQSLSVPVVMIVGSLVSLICVERLGRKPLLVSMLTLAGLSMLGMGTVILVQYQGHIVPWWLPVLFIITAVFAQAAGMLPVNYIVMAEMFNFQIRSKLMGIIVAISWFVVFFQLTCFSSISETLGMHTSYFIFGAVNFLGLFIALFYLPETKGKSVEEIEFDMSKKYSLKF